MISLMSVYLNRRLSISAAFILLFVLFISCGSTIDEKTVERLLNPEISIRIEATDVHSGESYNLGDVVTGTNMEVTVYIENNGNNELSLKKAISLSGEDTDQFSIKQPINYDIPLGERESFSITFSPDSLGEKSVVVTIHTNDLDEESYEIILNGTVISGITYPERGLYGDNILNDSFAKSPKNDGYSFAVELEDSTKVRVVVPIPNEDWRTLLYKANMWWWAAHTKENWYEGMGSSGEPGEKRVFITESSGISDIEISFTGHNSIEIEIYENDATVPTRTKTIVW